MSERFMGEFDPKATYKKGDVVTLNGEAYRRVRDDGGKVDPFQTMPYRVWQKKSEASGGLVNLLGPGGGGTSDAVQYIPQELTEEQQMQARKNLGVYYKENVVAEVLPLTKVIPEDAGPMGYAMELPFFRIIPGKKYTVDVNGETYEVTAFSFVVDETTLNALGSAIDTSSMSYAWDYPFSIVEFRPGTLDVYFQNAGEYEISVSAMEEHEEKIEPEYIQPFFKANVIDVFEDEETGTMSVQTDLNYDYFNKIITDPKGLAMNAGAFLLRLSDDAVYPCVAITKGMTSSRGRHIILEFWDAYCGRQELYKQRYYVVLQKSETEEGVYYSELLKTPVEHVTFE